MEARLWALVALLALALATPLAVGADEDGEDGADGGDPWTLEELRTRVAYMEQRGHGIQSQASRTGGPGRERLRVFQPMGSFRLRHKHATHEVSLALDVVSSASADALDAISHASRENEAGTIDITSAWDATPDDHLSFTEGYHHEEPLASGFFNLGYTRDLADDNATLGVSGGAIFDFFDPLTPSGFDPGFARRQTYTVNTSFSQILSPTTLFAATYGITHQRGTLQTTWNSTPVIDDIHRAPEVFPRTRTRHALGARLLQMIEPSRTTFELRYRYYRDDLGLEAHTGELRVSQYIGPHILAGTSYRLHHQDGISFYREAVPSGFDPELPLTSDSDLSTFWAHEVAWRLTFFLNSVEVGDAISMSYVHYTRSNDLDLDLASIGWVRRY